MRTEGCHSQSAKTYIEHLEVDVVIFLCMCKFYLAFFLPTPKQSKQSLVIRTASYAFDKLVEIQS